MKKQGVEGQGRSHRHTKASVQSISLTIYILCFFFLTYNMFLYKLTTKFKKSVGGAIFLKSGIMEVEDGPLGFPGQVLTPMVQRKEQVMI